MSGLYIVATPIGNMGDVSERAIQILGSVDVIAAEDTRHSGQLLKHLGIKTRTIALHAHNEQSSTNGILKLLQSGQSVALISDAGTPLISDPGYLLVHQCHEAGIDVVPVPGPSSVAAALSVSGLPVNRFSFEGFLPSKAGNRVSFLQALRREQRTLVLFETPHRIAAAVTDIARVFGEDRRMTLCRELTKTFEQIVTDTAGGMLRRIEDERIPCKGEFVLVVAGAETTSSINADRLLTALLDEVSPSKAAAITAKVTDSRRDALYQRALELKERLES
jgi:16S rRNA (cytidine1402-2'-O)-methyltransferase